MRWEPATASQILTQHLTHHGLAAYAYTGADGNTVVHAALAAAHGAGTDITVIPDSGGDGCAFMSEWGSDIGDTAQLPAVVAYIMWLFGLASSPRR